MGLRDRHLYEEQQVFFITTTCHRWLPLLNVGRSFKILADSLMFCCEKYRAKVLGYVFMPNHIHIILHFEDASLRSALMRDFKKFTSTMIRKEIEHEQPELLKEIEITEQGRAFRVWMERFDEVYLKSEKLLEVKLGYIHMNPLQEQWSLVDYPEDYPHSSAGFYEQDRQGNVRLVHYKEVI